MADNDDQDQQTHLDSQHAAADAMREYWKKLGDDDKKEEDNN